MLRAAPRKAGQGSKAICRAPRGPARSSARVGWRVRAGRAHLASEPTLRPVSVSAVLDDSQVYACS